MAHEQILGTPISPENLLYQSETYDLGWDGFRGSLPSPHDDSATLPTADHAIYLINAVKFHVGQMFHLFDEESFMRSFSIFHSPTADKSAITPLWVTHYMLILAFGKAFLARTVKGRRPPGAEFFVQAMKTLPDVTFLCMHPIETLEILCCATLYMQSIDFRSPAYQLVCSMAQVHIRDSHTDHPDRLDKLYELRSRTECIPTCKANTYQIPLHKDAERFGGLSIFLTDNFRL